MPNPLVTNQQQNNPIQILEQMAQTNPQAQQVLNMLRMGQNPQELFYQMCRQRGIEPQAFLNQMNNYR